MFLAGVLSLFLAQHESLADRFMDNHPIIANKTRIGRVVSGYNEVENSIPYGQVDWSTYLGKSSAGFLEDVLLAAEKDPAIQYCLFVDALVLELQDADGNEHLFYYGETAFFSEIPQLADDRKGISYYKTPN